MIPSTSTLFPPILVPYFDLYSLLVVKRLLIDTHIEIANLGTAIKCMGFNLFISFSWSYTPVPWFSPSVRYCLIGLTY